VPALRRQRIKKNMLPVKFDFTVSEDRRGTNFEGVEARPADLEGAFNLHVRIARDHLVLSVWPVKGEIVQVTDHLSQILGPPKATPSVCGFGDCQDDDKDAPQQTTMWDFEPADRPEILQKVRTFLGLQ
jgi:hypothetical protein